MRPQIELDAEDILLCLQQFLALYANVLTPDECKALAQAMQVLIHKSK